MALAFAILLLSASHGWGMRIKINPTPKHMPDEPTAPADSFCDNVVSADHCKGFVLDRCEDRCRAIDWIAQSPDDPDDSEVPVAPTADEGDNQFATQSLEDPDAEPIGQLPDGLDDSEVPVAHTVDVGDNQFATVMKVGLKEGKLEKSDGGEKNEKKDKSEKKDQSEKKNQTDNEMVNGVDGEEKEKKEVDGDKKEKKNKPKNKDKKDKESKEKREKSDEKGKDKKDAEPTRRLSDGHDDSEVPVAPTAGGDFDYGTSGTIVQLMSSGFGFIRPDTSTDNNHNLYFHVSGVAGGTSFSSFRTGDRMKYEVGVDERRNTAFAKQVDFDYGTSGTIVNVKRSGPVRYCFIKPDTSNDDNHILYFPADANRRRFFFRTGERVKYKVGLNERRNQTIAKQVEVETTLESRSRERGDRGARGRGRDDFRGAERWSRSSPLLEETGALAEDADLDKVAAQQGGANAAPKRELHSWCLWLHQHPGSQNGGVWTESQRIVHEFATAEDFWSMSLLSYPPSQLENVDYSLFQQGITPAWEDPAFKNGGRWVVKLEKVQAQSLDDLWLSLGLALIGEAFIENGGELVCGATVSVQSHASKLALWISAATERKKVLAIGREYRNVLASTPGFKDFASKELTFEDFKRQAVTFNLNWRTGRYEQFYHSVA